MYMLRTKIYMNFGCKKVITRDETTEVKLESQQFAEIQVLSWSFFNLI